MIKSYLATKQNMTQTWDDSGKRLPITILITQPAIVTQVKTQEKDGYQAVQLGLGTKKSREASKPLKGSLKKAKIKSIPKLIKEIKTDSEVTLKIGETITIDQILNVGDIVKVQGVSKGRGFTGVMKRWKFSGGPRTHGQSDRQRAPGSIGQGTDPGRVHKGKKMPGRHGNQTFTINNLKVIKVDSQANELWVNGPIPGSRGSTIVVTKTGKAKTLQEKPADPPVEKPDKPSPGDTNE